MVNYKSTSLLPSRRCHAKYQSRQPSHFSSAERRKDSEGNSHLRLQMFGLQKHRTEEWWGSDLFSGAFFFFLYHQTAGLRTPFNPIKDDEQSQQARGVRDEVLQGHHRWSPLSLLNCWAPCQDFLFQSSSHLITAWKYLTFPSPQALE